MTAREYFKTKSTSMTRNVIDLMNEFAKMKIDELTNEKSQYSIMYGNQEKRIATNNDDFTIDEFLNL